MKVEEAVIATIKNLIIPELDEIKKSVVIVNTRLDSIDKRFEDMRSDVNNRFEDMNKRFEEMRFDMNNRFEDMRADMNKRFEDMRSDMNERFEEHYNFNMKRFDSLEIQIHTMLEEMRDMRRLHERKVDIDDFRRLENNYIELLKEVTILKQRVGV